jgi:hypothetical protein
MPLAGYLASEGRFDRLMHAKDAPGEELLRAAASDVSRRWTLYEQLAGLSVERKAPS